MRRDENVIIDVGLHNGDDTAYYLHKGFSVVAIDANPAMVESARGRFKVAVANGRLTLMNVGIASKAGEQDFFVSQKNSEWSSFDAGNATKDGSGSTTIRVPCIPFAEVLEISGVPRYLKIDIEGNDRLCLEALDPALLPDFVSLEMSHQRGDQDIRLLETIGYNQFKCIRQNDLTHFTPENIGRKLAFRRLAVQPGILGKILRACRTLGLKIFPPRDGRWKFPRGSSGHFGDDLAGRWLSVEEMLAIWKALQKIDRELSARGLGDWFDIHATQR